MSWYTKVSQDIGLIPDCIKHFDQEFEVARKERIIEVYDKKLNPTGSSFI